VRSFGIIAGVLFTVALACLPISPRIVKGALIKMSDYDFDDDVLGGEDDLQDAAGDELDFAAAVARANPASDQLEHFANMRSAKHGFLNAQAPFVRNNPVSILTGSLGNQAQVFLGPKPSLVATGISFRGPTQQVASWSGEDAETLPVTITLGHVSATLGVKGSVVYATKNPYAIIKWGTRGSLLSAEIDIGLGCQLTVGASMVTVEVGEEGAVANAATPEVPSVLAGMISMHQVVRTQQITRTVRVIAGTPVTVFKIPAFAKSVVVEIVSSTEAAIFTFYNNLDGACGTFLFAAGVQGTTPITLPNEAVGFRIYDSESSGTPNNVAARAIFNLAL